MPTPPQIVNQVMEAVNPLWNSNTTIHIGVIAIPGNVHTINAMPFVPFCLAYEAGRNDSSTKPRSIEPGLSRLIPSGRPAPNLNQKRRYDDAIHDAGPLKTRALRPRN